MPVGWDDTIPAEEEEQEPEESSDEEDYDDDDPYPDEDKEYRRWNRIIQLANTPIFSLLCSPPPELEARIEPIFEKYGHCFSSWTPLDYLSRLREGISELESFLAELRREDPVLDWCIKMALALRRANEEYP